MCWDLGVVMPLLMYLTVIMPFRLCYQTEAELYSNVFWFEFIIDMLFIIDIVLNFLTGYAITDVAGEDSEIIEYDRYRVAVNYFQTWFLLDVISGIPFALFDLIMQGESSSGGVLKSAKTLKVLRFLKLGRLLKFEKILSNLDRDTKDTIEDFFQVSIAKECCLCSILLLLRVFVCLRQNVGALIFSSPGFPFN
jgi:hypothetical protein